MEQDRAAARREREVVRQVQAAPALEGGLVGAPEQRGRFGGLEVRIRPAQGLLGKQPEHLGALGVPEGISEVATWILAVDGHGEVLHHRLQEPLLLLEGPVGLGVLPGPFLDLPAEDPGPAQGGHGQGQQGDEDPGCPPRERQGRLLRPLQPAEPLLVDAGVLAGLVEHGQASVQALEEGGTALGHGEAQVSGVDGVAHPVHVVNVPVPHLHGAQEQGDDRGVLGAGGELPERRRLGGGGHHLGAQPHGLQVLVHLAAVLHEHLPAPETIQGADVRRPVPYVDAVEHHEARGGEIGVALPLLRAQHAGQQVDAPGFQIAPDAVPGTRGEPHLQAGHPGHGPEQVHIEALGFPLGVHILVGGKVGVDPGGHGLGQDPGRQQPQGQGSGEQADLGHGTQHGAPHGAWAGEKIEGIRRSVHVLKTPRLDRPSGFVHCGGQGADMFNPPHPLTYADAVRAFLREDWGTQDWTSASVPDRPVRARVTAKAEVVLAGLPVVQEVFRAVDAGLVVEALVADGSRGRKGHGGAGGGRLQPLDPHGRAGDAEPAPATERHGHPDTQLRGCRRRHRRPDPGHPARRRRA